MIFTNTQKCWTDTSTNVRSATKMMLQPIGIRILKRYELTTGRVEDHQSVSRLIQKLPEHGERRTLEGHGLTRVFPEPSRMAV
jgi:hypothetical protein